MTKEKFESENAELQIINGILIGTHKPSVITLDVAKAIVEERLAYIGDGAYPLLVKEYSVAKIEKEARDFFYTADSYKGITACAVITSSVFKMTLANFFIKMSKQPFPVKLFKTEDDALNWLKNYIDAN